MQHDIVKCPLQQMTCQGIRFDNITLNVPSRAFSNVPFVTDSNVPLQKWLL